MEDPGLIWTIVQDNKVLLMVGLLLGFLAALIFSGLSLFLATKNRNFLLLSIGFVIQGVTLLVLYGFAGFSGWFYQAVLFSSVSGYLICNAFFALSLLRVRKRHIRLLRLVRGLIAIGVVLMLVNLLLPKTIGSAVVLVYAWLMLAAMMTLGVWGWRNQVLTAKWFSCGWGFCALALIRVTQQQITEVELSLLAFNLLVSTIWLANVLWFIAAVRQYMEEKKAQLAKQQRALSDTKHKEAMQQQKLEVEEQLREELEIKFQERNFELEVTLRELEETNRELEQKNTQDALTGMRNRRFFDKKYLAESRRSRREQTELSLVMLDIDHFKQVNDTYGHLAGDDVIRYVGRTITDTLKRTSDDGCRYGGEEFALILPNTDAQGAIGVAESVRKKLESATIDTQSGPLQITVSCGVFTAIAFNGMEQAYFIELADKALYHAKHSGRNKVVHYQDHPEADQGQELPTDQLAQ